MNFLYTKFALLFYSRFHSGYNFSCIFQRSLCNTLTWDVREEDETFYFNDTLQNWNIDCLSNAESWTSRLLLQPSVSGVTVSLLVSGLTVDILSTFYGVFVVQYVKLMLRIFEFGILLCDCFVYRQNVSCHKRFRRYKHYAGEVEETIIGRLVVVS